MTMVAERKLDDVTNFVSKYAVKSSFYKISKTISLIVTWICLGLCMGIAAPTLIDLKLRTHSNYEEVAFGVSGISIGYFIGAFLGGFLLDKLQMYSDLMIFVCQVLTAVFAALVPWFSHYMMIFLMFALVGVFASSTDVAGEKAILELWGKKASSPLHALHGGFGIGCFIVPLISNPFLAGPLANIQNNYTTPSVINLTGNSVTVANSTGSDSTRSSYVEQQNESQSRIEYAYGISAAITVVCSFVYLAYHFAGKRKRKVEKAKQKNLKTPGQPLKRLVNPATCASGDFVYGLKLFVLLFLYFFHAVGGEVISGNFVRAFSIDQLKFSKDDASYLNTTFYISYTVGRFFGLFTGRLIPIRILILLESGAYLLTSILLTIFGHGNSMALWVLAQPLGFFISPLFPSGIGWAGWHLKMSGLGISVLMLGCSFGVLSYMRLFGFLYDTYGPRTFQYANVFSSAITFTIAVLMDVTGSRHGRQFQTVGQSGDEVVLKEISI